MTAAAWKVVVSVAALATLVVGAAAASTRGVSADFTVSLIRSSVSSTDATVTVQGKLSEASAESGLRPRIVVVAAVSQTCVAVDGTTYVAQAELDSATASHFFTTTIRHADGKWQATVAFTSPADATICAFGEQSAGDVSVGGMAGSAFLAPAGVGSPPPGSRVYSFVLPIGKQVLAPPELTYTIA